MVGVGAVVIGAVWLLPALGNECYGVRDYPDPGGDGFYCVGALGPADYWLNDHLFAVWASAAAAVCGLSLLARGWRARSH